MRISFVGKGGSGKSTLSSSFASYVSKETDKAVVIFDADLNIHIPRLLEFDTIPFEKHLSHPQTSTIIKKWLIGANTMSDMGAFRKSTPPTRKSNILNIASLQDTPLSPFGLHRDNLSVFAVGTYQEEDIGASCYHNNLAIFESVLTHMDDKDGYLIADMVAGVDSFAGTLHAQFDLTCFIVEPTMRSVEVFIQYMKLATEAGVGKRVRVIGNKIRDKKDIEFIKNHVPENVLIGFFVEDEHIRDIDRDGGALTVSKLNQNNKDLLKDLLTTINSVPDNRNGRLKDIWSLHRKYVGQQFIKDRFGDLTNQIDPEFNFDHE